MDVEGVGDLSDGFPLVYEPAHQVCLRRVEFSRAPEVNPPPLQIKISSKMRVSANAAEVRTFAILRGRKSLMPVGFLTWRTLSSQSSPCVRPVLRGAVAGIRAPACSVLLGRAHAIYGCANCGVGVGLRRGLGRQQPARNARRISLRSAHRERAAMHRVPRLAAVFGSLRQARSNRRSIVVAARGPPSEARDSSRPRSTRES